MLRINTGAILVNDIKFYESYVGIHFYDMNEHNSYMQRVNNAIIKVTGSPISNFKNLTMQYNAKVNYDKLEIIFEGNKILTKNTDYIKRIMSGNRADFYLYYEYRFENRSYYICPVLVAIVITKPKNKMDDSCVICFEDINERIALIPCGHASFCKKCITALTKKTCPICGSDYTNHCKIYI
jgi:hypothetical protein